MGQGRVRAQTRCVAFTCVTCLPVIERRMGVHDGNTPALQGTRHGDTQLSAQLEVGASEKGQLPRPLLDKVQRMGHLLGIYGNSKTQNGVVPLEDLATRASVVCAQPCATTSPCNPVPLPCVVACAAMRPEPPTHTHTHTHTCHSMHAGTCQHEHGVACQHRRRSRYVAEPRRRLTACLACRHSQHAGVVDAASAQPGSRPTWPMWPMPPTNVR